MFETLSIQHCFPLTSPDLLDKHYKRKFASIRKHSSKDLLIVSAYAPFTPSHHGQRLPPLFYRGCWQRVAQDYLFHSAPAYNKLVWSHLSNKAKFIICLQSYVHPVYKKRGQVTPLRRIAQYSILPPIL
jgi:hypothetical protein